MAADDIRALAERCAHELHGYRVPVEAGTELETITARIDQLDRCCASYSRALRTMHVAADRRASIDTPDVSLAPIERYQPRRDDDVEIWLSALAARRFPRETAAQAIISNAMEEMLGILRYYYVNHADRGVPLITDAEREGQFAPPAPVECCTPDPFEPPCSPDCPRYLPPDPPERPRPPVPDLMAALEKSLEDIKRRDDR